MATYNTLRFGSKGEDVKKLQQSLGFTGKDVDGIYGSQTEEAVRNYQKKNGLSVDGIAGNQTLGKLYATAPATTTAPTTKDNSFKYQEFEYTDPADNDMVKQANAMLQEQMANKPGEYTSPWQAQLNDTLNKILNREEFSYDLNGDVLYQQYKDQFTNQGKQAMMDTMGQAAAMTGGYGNSYAQTVGQQTYQGYLQQLNDKVPELYQIALSQYNQEGQDLKDQAILLGQQEEKDYGRHRDNVSDYYTELDYLTGRADTAYDKAVTERDFGAGLWADKQEYDYKTSESTQSKAYDTAMSMISLGVTPSAQMLADAGISASDAKAMVDKVLANEAEAKKKAQTSTAAKGTAKTVASNAGKAVSNTVKNAVGKVADTISGKNKDDTPEFDYSGWGASDWNEYFAGIRQSEGVVAAHREADRLSKAGLLPDKYKMAARVGATLNMGH